jgi:hypothetical protein
MPFATITNDSEIPEKYYMNFDTLKDYTEQEYVIFKNEFVYIVCDESLQNKNLIIDTTQIEKIPIFHLYDFSTTLNEIKETARKNVNTSTIRLDSKMVKYAFKLLFKLSPPFSEIIYEEN